MGKSQQILVTAPEKPKHEAKSGPVVGRMALVAGIFIIIVGWVDILVGWFPLGFGSPEWLFGATWQCNQIFAERNFNIEKIMFNNGVTGYDLYHRKENAWKGGGEKGWFA